MDRGKIYLLIEGLDDLRFFENIIIPSLLNSYGEVKLWMYAEESKRTIRNFIRSINQMGSNIVFITDIDSFKCISNKKDKIKKIFPDDIDIDCVMVVRREIESWYLAGLTDSNAKKLAKRTFKSTEQLSKDQFNRLIPKKYDSRIDFMQEIIKNYSIEVAITKNLSFRYFCKRIGII